MARKKEEDRKRRYKDESEKKKAHSENEKHIENCFSKFVGYWGIDCAVVEVNITKISKTKLLNQRSNFCKAELIPNRDEKSKDVFEIFEKIEIYDPTFGRLTVGHGSHKPFDNYARLQLFHTGINVETGCMKDIWNRYEKAVKRLNSIYGISLDHDPNVYKIEPCLTFASDKVIPLLVRKYLIAAFSESSRVNAKNYTSTSTKYDKHLVTSGHFENQEIVLYDKTAKAEYLNQISKKIKHKLRVYRLEFCIEKSKLKQDKALRATLLSNLPEDEKLHSIKLSDLKDDNIYAYCKMRVDKAIDYYRFNMLSMSLEATAKYLKMARKVDPIHYTSHFDGYISTEQAEHDYSLVIDDESILFANLNKVFTKTNLARSRKSLLFSKNSSDFPRKHMYGWEVERIFAMMIHCFENGLGNKAKYSSLSPAHLVVADENYDQNEKQEYLLAVIGSTRKNKHINYANLVLSRIMTYWSYDNIYVPSIDSLNDHSLSKETTF